MYARQLAEHYQSQGGQQGQGGYGSRTSERRPQPYARSNNQNKDEREYSFFDGTFICVEEESRTLIISR